MCMAKIWIRIVSFGVSFAMLKIPLKPCRFEATKAGRQHLRSAKDISSPKHISDYIFIVKIMSIYIYIYVIYIITANVT